MVKGIQETEGFGFFFILSRIWEAGKRKVSWKEKIPAFLWYFLLNTNFALY